MTALPRVCIRWSLASTHTPYICMWDPTRRTLHGRVQHRAVENYQQKTKKQKNQMKVYFPHSPRCCPVNHFFHHVLPQSWSYGRYRALRSCFHFSTLPLAPQLLIPNSLLLSRMYPAPFLSASASVHEHTFIMISLWSVFPTRLEAS